MQVWIANEKDRKIVFDNRKDQIYKHMSSEISCMSVRSNYNGSVLTLCTDGLK